MAKKLSDILNEAKKIKKKKTVKPVIDYPRGVIVPIVPVHGEHARPRNNRKKSSDKIINESLNLQGWHDFQAQNANQHLGPDSDDVHNVLSDHYHLGKFDEDNIRELTDYTDGSNELNRYLINQATDREANNSIHEHSKIHLDDALNKHRTPEDLVVYHGGNFNPDEYASQHPHRVIRMPPYISTSITKHTARKFAQPLVMSDGSEARHILEIHVPEGHPGFYLGAHSTHPRENEFLLPRDLDLKIHPEPRLYDDGTKSDDGTKRPIYVWTASIHNNAKNAEAEA